MVTTKLVNEIITQHHLRDRLSIHYIDHWARVVQIGRRLAPLTGARLDVVEFFAVFHDSGRWNDGADEDHGLRGALVAEWMRDLYFNLDDEGMHLLIKACREHTWGKIQADITVQTCWDSDRLDLGRAGIVPHPARLCTQAGRDPMMISWAHQLSVQRFVPLDIFAEWGL